VRRASVAAFVAIGLWMMVPASASAALEGIHKIQHVVVIMQENRSFDSYFGTYPGAKGIPAGVCVPDPLHGGCVEPFHDPDNENYGGPHGHNAFLGDLHGGKMDGFVGQAEKGLKCSSTEPGCSPCTEESSSGQCVDSMGYHDAREIPNYWTYAQDFALQDDLFEPNSSWSWPAHLFMVSGWSAICEEDEKWSENPLSCEDSIEGPTDPSEDKAFYEEHSLPWTDVTYLLHKHKPEVSWRYFIFEGGEPDCESNEAMTCEEVKQGPRTPGIWNPLVDFEDVKEDGQLSDVQSLTKFYSTVHNTSECNLPNVSWIIPNFIVSEHPPSLISAGQAYVTTLINSIMRSPCWGSTAIFLSWDDWGGFYDNVVPPVIDSEGYGFRVPGLVISPYAKAGYIDNQQLSHEAYLKFIEDDFLEAQRLNPKTDGRPDSRPDVREEAPGLGNIEADFDFNQSPLPPVILPPEPAPGPASCPPGSVPSGAPQPEALAACPYPTPSMPSTPSTPQTTASTPSTSQTSTPSDLAPVTPLTLQLTASVAPRQDLRLNAGRIYLTVGCNMACSLFAHGHLNLMLGRRRLELLSARKTLVGHRSAGITLSLSRSGLVAARSALRAHRHVEALISVEVRAPGQPLRGYLVSVRLTYR
jgi:phospholipase C